MAGLRPEHGSIACRAEVAAGCYSLGIALGFLQGMRMRARCWGIFVALVVILAGVGFPCSRLGYDSSPFLAYPLLLLNGINLLVAGNLCELDLPFYAWTMILPAVHALLLWPLPVLALWPGASANDRFCSFVLHYFAVWLFMVLGSGGFAIMIWAVGPK